MPITVGTLGTLRSVTQRNREVVFSFESSELIVTSILPNVIRHTWVPTHWRLYTHRGFDTHAVQRRSWPATPAPIITETADTVRMSWENFASKPRGSPFISAMSRLTAMSFSKRSKRAGCHGRTGNTPYAIAWPLRITSMGWARRINWLITSTLIIAVTSVKYGTNTLPRPRLFPLRC